MSDEMGKPSDGDGPSDDHVRFWDEWNTTWRVRDDHDSFMQRQAEIVRAVAERERLDEASILDVGCGTGWLGNELVAHGNVTGTDLSPEAIRAGSERYPDVSLRSGDFMSLDLSGPFDLIISSDSLVPMPDHARCIARVAELQRQGGVFVLMTQNPFVWARRSAIRHHDPSVPNGRVEQWPDRRRVLELLAPYYSVSEISTIVPGGDRGVLFWVENRYIRGGMSRLLGRARWSRLLERASLGRELVIVARRR